VSELTFGAKIVNHEYREYINSHKDQEIFITSPCPSIVNLVKNQFPKYSKYLLPFDSPMVAMAKIVRHNYPGYKIVFASPCTAKKLEAKNSGIIDCAVTFKELKEIMINEKIKYSKKKLHFESFYNEFTKIYPLGGGLAKSMHAKKIFKKSEIVSCDDCKNLKQVLSIKGVRFFDLLFCKGGCVGGNGIMSPESTAKKRKKIIDYKNHAEQEGLGKHMGLINNSKGIDFKASY
jgi:iron only hydrogenase large subunit-like protein